MPAYHILEFGILMVTSFINHATIHTVQMTLNTLSGKMFSFLTTQRLHLKDSKPLIQVEKLLVWPLLLRFNLIFFFYIPRIP